MTDISENRIIPVSNSKTPKTIEPTEINAKFVAINLDSAKLVRVQTVNVNPNIIKNNPGIP